MQDKKVLLRCTNLCKSYGDGGQQREILKNVNLEIQSGGIHQICGKSGSGKTTLLNLLAGLNRATAGSICFGGREYEKLSETELARLRGEFFGYVFQSFHLLRNITAEENIKAPAYINGRKEDAEYMGYLAEMLFSDSRRLFVLAGGVLLLALSFVLFFVSLSSTIVASKRQQTVDTHGKFLGVFSDIEEETAKEIMETEPVFCYELFQMQAMRDFLQAGSRKRPGKAWGYF